MATKSLKNGGNPTKQPGHSSAVKADTAAIAARGKQTKKINGLQVGACALTTEHSFGAGRGPWAFTICTCIKGDNFPAQHHHCKDPQRSDLHIPRIYLLQASLKVFILKQCQSLKGLHDQVFISGCLRSWYTQDARVLLLIGTARYLISLLGTEHICIADQDGTMVHFLLSGEPINAPSIPAACDMPGSSAGTEVCQNPAVRLAFTKARCACLP